MAKARVERAPDFSLSTVDYEKLSPYLSQYGVTDKKGRYLHWSELKWRVPQSEAHDIWQVVKLKRSLQAVSVPLFDEKNKSFSYCIPHAMEAKLHEITKIAGGSVSTVAHSVASDTIQRKFLVSSLMMEEAITSAQLEGAATTREVAKKMLEDGRSPVTNDEKMILNNYRLLAQAEACCKEELTVDLILEFHRIATYGTSENNNIPGEFRLADDIYVEDDGEVSYRPPSFESIPIRLQKLCEFANGDHSGRNGNAFILPVIKAITLHFMVGYEHAFRDGNGRTARAIFYWYMLKNDYDLFKYISISKLLKDKPKPYGLSYLYTEKDQNDLTYFINHQVDTIISALDELKKYLQKKTEEFHRVVECLSDSKFSEKLNFTQKDLIKKGTKNPGRIFTVKEVASSYEVSEGTARAYLNELVTLKLLLQSKDGRTMMYFSPADLNERINKK